MRLTISTKMLDFCVILSFEDVGLDYGGKVGFEFFV